MERRDEQSIEAVKLYYQQGLSQAEVAEVLRIGPDAVRGQLFRARRALEERMARWR